MHKCSYSHKHINQVSSDFQVQKKQKEKYVYIIEGEIEAVLMYKTDTHARLNQLCVILRPMNLQLWNPMGLLL